MFRRPKKPIQRRVYSAEDDAENGAAQDDDSSKMDIVQENSPPPPPPPTISNVPKDRKSEKKNKDSNRKVPMAKSSLLSFGDEGKTYLKLTQLIWFEAIFFQFVIFFLCRGRRWSISSEEDIAKQESDENDGQRATQEEEDRIEWWPNQQ